MTDLERVAKAIDGASASSISLLAAAMALLAALGAYSILGDE